MEANPVRTSPHLDRLISEKSIKMIEEIHERPKLKENFTIDQFNWPKLGSLSYLKPMIEENNGSVIERLEQGENEISLCPSSRASDETNDADKKSPTIKLNEFQLELYSLLRTYKDLLYTNESIESLDDMQQVYVLHVVKHLMNSRSKIISNNRVFERKTISDNVLQDDPVLRDQGFTRAKILFLLPFRYSALRLGKCIAKTLGTTHNIIHMDRFFNEFGDDDGADSTLRPVASDGNKPNDFYHTFHGNIDDSFRVGIKLTKKSVKFFTDFYDSDIIIASPLGLKTLITVDESTHKFESTSNEQLPGNSDRDFLSSIEMVVLDQAEIFLMQNWEHVVDLMRHVNQIPSKPRKMDVARIRPWHLENWSKYYRQLIMFTSITVPLIHSFFQTNSLNYEGYLAFKHKVESPQAKQVTTKCTQHFLYYESQSANDLCDNRFSFFIKHVLPRYTRPADTSNGNSTLDHTLILVSSYFDYVRLRNYFRREKLSFTQICEYTEDNKVSKARQLFYFGARQFLLYTERCHFYHRYKFKGIRNIVFYEPPMFAKFYTEVLNMLAPELQGKKFDENSTRFTATTLFSNYDTLQLGAIVGFSNAAKLIQNKKSIT